MQLKYHSVDFIKDLLLLFQFPFLKIGIQRQISFAKTQNAKFKFIPGRNTQVNAQTLVKLYFKLNSVFLLQNHITHHKNPLPEIDITQFICTTQCRLEMRMGDI